MQKSTKRPKVKTYPSESPSKFNCRSVSITGQKNNDVSKISFITNFRETTQ